MRKIYEKATRVHVWLGPAADDSDIVVDAMKELVRHVRSLRDVRTSPWDFVENLKVSEILGEPGSPEIRVWTAIRALANPPWWRRTWTLQEATALDQRRTLFSCGDKHLGLMDLIDVRYFLSAIYYKPRILGFEMIYQSGLGDAIRQIWDFGTMRKKE
jgi:hypothetical protein